MPKTKRQMCFERMAAIGPEWKAVLSFTVSDGSYAICLTRHGDATSQPLALFRYRRAAEKLVRDLNQFHAEVLAKAYP